MKQLTTEQAIKFAKSRVYDNWTFEQIVRFQLFQKKLCMSFALFHKAVENVLNRKVFIHEFGIDDDLLIKEYLGQKEPPTLDEIINYITNEKQIIIGL